jgi:O-antigen/teichoic acid export membrane protein
VVFVAVAAGPLVQVLYGPAYSSATLYLRLIAISNLSVIIGQTVIPSFLNGIGRTRLTFVLNVVAAAVVLTLAPALGNGLGLGVEGLIYSLLASNLLSTLIGLGLLGRLLKAGIEIKSIALMLFASLIASGIVYVLEATQFSAAVTLVLQLAVFSIAYLTFVPLFRAVDEADLERLSIAIEGLGPLEKLLSPIIRYEQRILRMWKQCSS